MQGKPIYEFGRFRLEPAERRLLHQGQPVSLSPQLFSLLVVFVENPGKLISKEALRNKVWGNAYVSEDALKVIIGNLRKAIGENGERYIETVRGGGYRFVSPVTTVEEVKQDLTEAGCDTGSSPMTKARLLKAIRESQVHGFVALALEARLALVELEARTGFSNTNDKTVASLIQEPNTRGFSVIADRAKTLQTLHLSKFN